MFNEFCRVLYIYERNNRSKLVPADLDKIAAKYDGKTEKLKKDMEKKCARDGWATWAMGRLSRGQRRWAVSVPLVGGSVGSEPCCAACH